MYEAVMAVHLLGAGATGLVGAYALVALWNRFDDAYRLCAVLLGSLAGFEILSGTALSVLSVQISAASICGRIFLYLSLVAILETLLFARMNKIERIFPYTQVLSPVAGSLVLLFSAIAYGI